LEAIKKLCLQDDQYLNKVFKDHIGED